MIGTESSLDTNILFYAFDFADTSKQRIASDVLKAAFFGRCPLTLQVLSEFYRVASSKLLHSSEAATIVETLRQNHSIVPANVSDLLEAIRLQQGYRLQFFDCMLLAAVARAGCTTLFSEDMQHLRTYGSVKVINPFVLGPAELELLLR